jgi:hypothetical protein
VCVAPRSGVPLVRRPTAMHRRPSRLRWCHGAKLGNIFSAPLRTKADAVGLLGAKSLLGLLQKRQPSQPRLRILDRDLR